MPVSIPHISCTAERAFGNGQFIGGVGRVSSTERVAANRGYAGTHSRVCAPSLRPAPGHRQFSGTPRDPTPIDSQAEAIRLRDEERLRRDLWANCERRPIAMDRA